jgi:hypothetical protein
MFVVTTLKMLSYHLKIDTVSGCHIDEGHIEVVLEFLHSFRSLISWMQFLDALAHDNDVTNFRIFIAVFSSRVESSFDDDESLLLLRADPNLVFCVIPVQFHEFFLFPLIVLFLLAVVLSTR